MELLDVCNEDSSEDENEEVYKEGMTKKEVELLDVCNEDSSEDEDEEVYKEGMAKKEEEGE